MSEDNYSPDRQGVVRDNLTIADLVAMPHLGLQLLAGNDAMANPVLWTHVSELSDPGPWLEGGELLIVNGMGIPLDPQGQVEYVSRLVHHRLAGLVVSVKAPTLSQECLDLADRLSFPILRLPLQVPFIELSYLVANASEKSTRGRLAQHLRIFETLRLRNSVQSNIVEIYSRLEQVSGYRLALVSPAGRPLLGDWRWVPDELESRHLDGSANLQVIPDGYVLPLFVGNRVTAYLVGKEDKEGTPGGLAALQHVSSLAALDAIDDQRRREVVHRQGSALLSNALDEDGKNEELEARFVAVGLDPSKGMRFLAFEESTGERPETEIGVRDWFADRDIPHLLLKRNAPLAVVGCSKDDLRNLAADLGIPIGVSPESHELAELPRMQRQALWSLSLAEDSSEGSVILAEQQFGLARWLNPDVETMTHLADGLLRPIMQHDDERGTELLHTLAVYFRHQGRLRPTAARLFVHEHTLRYRLKRIEQLTGRSLKSYRDAFELWLALEANSLIENR
jgi:PucR family transcriptional regulator, purine catabolism regulatory protein